MATRLFFANAAAPATPAAVLGAWDLATATSVNLLGAKTGASANATVNETSTSGTYDVLLRRFVSGPFLSAGTLGGTVSYVLGVKESQTSADAAAHVHIWIMKPDGTARGTTLADYVSASGNEFGVNSPVAKGETAIAVTNSVACLAGDRIVAEIGYIARNVTSSSRGCTIYYGGTGSDLVLGSTGMESSQPGWIEFSGADELFVAAPVDERQADLLAFV